MQLTPQTVISLDHYNYDQIKIYICENYNKLVLNPLGIYGKILLEIIRIKDKLIFFGGFS